MTPGKCTVNCGTEPLCIIDSATHEAEIIVKFCPQLRQTKLRDWAYKESGIAGYSSNRWQSGSAQI